jgi:hypothetical protein
MNPFVGLSKVTKKRLDALENFTKEVEGVKTRIGELESVLEKTGVTIGGSISPSAVESTDVVKTISETPPITTVAPIMPSSLVPRVMQPTSGENISEKDMDELLSKSLESLLIEQNIDTMINEFFISLK